jgi:prepilin-type N-terminal cleavage/methylation domain-containing protein
MLTHTRPIAKRRGFSLVELLIVVVLLGIVMGSLMNVILRQQRFYRGAATVIDTRSQLRQAADVLPTDLRAISTVTGLGAPAGSDIIRLRSDSLIFRATVGSSMACTIMPGNVIRLPPADSLANGNVLSAWPRGAPAVGDTVFIFNEGGGTGPGDNSWPSYRITAVMPFNIPCGATPYVNPANNGVLGYQMTLDRALTAGTVLGAPLRVVRRVIYTNYQASDGKWYLGYSECPNNVCAAMQPVSGPYRPRAAAGTGLSGFEVTYYDSTGAVSANAGRVHQIKIDLRADGQEPVALAGGRSSTFRDSLSIRVGIRNKS